MKRLTLLCALPTLLVLLMSMSACSSDEILKAGASTLQSAKAVYVYAGKAAVKLQEEGTITLDQYDKAREISKDYKAAYNVLATALFEYGVAAESGVGKKEAMDQVIYATKALANNYQVLVDAFNEFGGDLQLPPFVNTLTTVIGG